jgi:hypothetical protein
MDVGKKGKGGPAARVMEEQALGPTRNTLSRALIVGNGCEPSYMSFAAISITEALWLPFLSPLMKALAKLARAIHRSHDLVLNFFY